MCSIGISVCHATRQGSGPSGRLLAKISCMCGVKLEWALNWQVVSGLMAM